MPGIELHVEMRASGRKGAARTQAEADAYHAERQAVVEANERKRAERLAMKAARQR